MRIVWTTESLLPSSSAHALFTLKMASALAAEGHSVRLLAQWHRARLPSAEAASRLSADFGLSPPVPLTYLPPGRVFFRAAPLVARLLGPELVYATEPTMAARAARLGATVVLDLHAHAGPGQTRMRAAIRSLCKQGRVAVWAFNTRRLMGLYRAEFDIPEARCVPHHNGIDVHQLGPAMDRIEARRALGLPGGDRTLAVHAGHLYPGRGAEEILGVAASLPEVDFLFVGGTTGDVADKKQKAKILGLGNVTFVEHQPPSRVPLYLGAADILLMPYSAKAVVSDGRLNTIDYASPMKMFDYMAAGRTIVATRFAGICEVLEDGRNAIIVAPDNVTELCRAITRAQNDPAWAARLADTARQDVRGYTWQARARRILSSAGAAHG